MDKINVLFPILLFIVWVVWRENSSARKKKNKIMVLYGYPKYCKIWLTIYHDRITGRYIFEWDDLFDDGRPDTLYPLTECYMFQEYVFQERNKPTQKEIDTAWAMLKERGLA